MKTKLILGLVLLFGLSIGANAQSIRGKDRPQHKRIEQGKRGGSLSKGEAYRFHQKKGNQLRKFHRFKRDGYLSHRGKQSFRHEQRKPGRHIYPYKYNGNRRFS